MSGATIEIVDLKTGELNRSAVEAAQTYANNLQASKNPLRKARCKAILAAVKYLQSGKDMDASLRQRVNATFSAMVNEILARDNHEMVESTDKSGNRYYRIKQKTGAKDDKHTLTAADVQRELGQLNSHLSDFKRNFKEKIKEAYRNMATKGGPVDDKTGVPQPPMGKERGAAKAELVDQYSPITDELKGKLRGRSTGGGSEGGEDSASASRGDYESELGIGDKSPEQLAKEANEANAVEGTYSSLGMLVLKEASEKVGAAAREAGKKATGAIEGAAGKASDAIGGALRRASTAFKKEPPKITEGVLQSDTASRGERYHGIKVPVGGTPNPVESEIPLTHRSIVSEYMTEGQYKKLAEFYGPNNIEKFKKDITQAKDHVGKTGMEVGTFLLDKYRLKPDVPPRPPAAPRPGSGGSESDIL